MSGWYAQRYCRSVACVTTDCTDQVLLCDRVAFLGVEASVLAYSSGGTDPAGDPAGAIALNTYPSVSLNNASALATLPRCA